MLFIKETDMKFPLKYYCQVKYLYSNPFTFYPVFFMESGYRGEWILTNWMAAITFYNKNNNYKDSRNGWKFNRLLCINVFIFKYIGQNIMKKNAIYN